MATKTNKSASGSGSIRQRPDGRWEARYSVGHDLGTGRPIRKSIYGATQAEVRRRLAQKIREVDTNSLVPDDRRTLAEYLDFWMTEYCEISLKPYTLTGYRSAIKNHIKPCIGSVRLCDLQTSHVQLLIKSLVKKGLSPKSVKNVHTTLAAALEQAVKDRVLHENPAKYAKLPKLKQPEINPLSLEEIVRFEAEAQESRYYAPFMVCLFLGLRESEALGLPWDAVDLARGKVTIRQQLQREKEAGGKFYIQGDTKSGRARTLDMPDFIADILREEQRQQLLNRIAAGAAWSNPWNLVFTDAQGGNLQPLALWREIKRIAARIGRPDLRVHDLRHTNATLSLFNGDDVKTVQANLGHATASFTLQRYIHATDQMKRDSANRMQAFYEQSLQKA